MLATVQTQAWIELACGNQFQQIQRAETVFGDCLVGVDGYRLHIDWYSSTAGYPALANNLNFLLSLFDNTAHLVIDARAELQRVLYVMAQRQTPPSESNWRHTLRRWLPLPTTPSTAPSNWYLPLEFISSRQRLVRTILVDYRFLRDALYGFNGLIDFWYNEHNANSPCAFGTAGQRMAIIMPAV